MAIHPQAGQPAPAGSLIDVEALDRDYRERKPDRQDPNQRVSFGTSGHRGSALHGSFNRDHILAITQAICDYRRAQGIDGPLFLGKDTHALSGPAQCDAIEVLAANGVETVIQAEDGFTPTPAISRAILVYNRDHGARRADGVVVTPSHNPPADGGIKYNPPHGGPADTDVTAWIEARANELLGVDNAGVRRMAYAAAIQSAYLHPQDLVGPYVEDLGNVVRPGRGARGRPFHRRRPARRRGCRLLAAHRRALRS